MSKDSLYSYSSTNVESKADSYININIYVEGIILFSEPSPLRVPGERTLPAREMEGIVR